MPDEEVRDGFRGGARGRAVAREVGEGAEGVTSVWVHTMMITRTLSLLGTAFGGVEIEFCRDITIKNLNEGMGTFFSVPTNRHKEIP